MKVLRVVIITIVVMVLISCATIPKAQNVEINHTARATEQIAEAIALLNAEYSERADKLVTEAEKRTAGLFAWAISHVARTGYTLTLTLQGAEVVETESTERTGFSFQLWNLNEEHIEYWISRGFDLVPTEDDPNIFNVITTERKSD